MMDGVTLGHEYKMKCVVSHRHRCLIKTNVKNTGKVIKIEVTNFLGQKLRTTVEMPPDCSVEASSDFKDITI